MSRMRREHPTGGEQRTRQDCAGDEGLVSMPLIIPPVKDKTYDLFGDLFSHLWHAAEQALVTADRIVIIGYSFPRTDHRSNRLFTDAFRQRKSLPRVVIINPHPEYLYDKFRLEFGIPDDKLIINADYFSAEFPIEEALSEE